MLFDKDSYRTCTNWSLTKLHILRVMLSELCNRRISTERHATELFDAKQVESSYSIDAYKI